MSRFNNPPPLAEQFRSMPMMPQQRPEQFIVDLEPKIVNSFNFSNVIRRHNINYKQPGLVEGSIRMSKNVYGSSAFAPRQLPPMKANNFI